MHTLFSTTITKKKVKIKIKNWVNNKKINTTKKLVLLLTAIGDICHHLMSKNGKSYFSFVKNVIDTSKKKKSLSNSLMHSSESRRWLVTYDIHIYHSNLAISTEMNWYTVHVHVCIVIIMYKNLLSAIWKEFAQIVVIV